MKPPTARSSILRLLGLALAISLGMLAGAIIAMLIIISLL
jgi:hypothetical protein